MYEVPGKERGLRQGLGARGQRSLFDVSHGTGRICVSRRNYIAVAKSS